ncbi:hypothetical protein GCM10009092_21320 [Bowmanella denitrificans]|uniref:PEP-CTERM protein-sorting domain-containing protein n=1 Tax=Bowmanella denitrificans TaxID=366582 RepID=A0ABN0X743_9ALTE
MKKLNFLKALLGLTALIASSVSQAALITLVPGQNTVSTGQNINLDIVISQLAPGGAPSLSGFDITLSFNNSLAGLDTSDTDSDGVFDAVTIDPASQLDLFGLGLNILGTTMLAPGQLQIFDLSFDLPTDLNDLQANSFVLASLTLAAQSPGLVDFVVNINGLADGLGNAISSQVSNASVLIEGSTTAIDEPSALLLLLVGMILLGRRHRAGKYISA